MADLTEIYESTFANAAESARRAAALLEGHKVVFVRGFLSELVLRIGEVIRSSPGAEVAAVVERITALVPLLPLGDRVLAPLRFGAYFDDQIAWLRDANIDLHAVEIESEAPIEVNAQAILAQIEDPAQRVTIISHSKGCLDVLHALLQRPSETWRHIDRWIAIQGPFHGTPVADFIAENGMLSAIADAVLTQVSRGSVESLLGMRTQVRGAYHRERKEAIEAVLAQIPTLCVGTTIPIEQISDTFLGGPLLLIEAMGGGANDGLVPIRSAFLSGAHGIELNGVDHAMPVMNSFGRFDRVAATQAMLCALER